MPRQPDEPHIGRRRAHLRWDLHEPVTYLGANIYTRPINTDVSRIPESEGMLSWRHRLSFTLGQRGSIEKTGQRKGIIVEGVVAGVAGA